MDIEQPVAPSVSSSAPPAQDFEKLADSRREAQAAGERIEAIRRKAGLPPSAEPAPPTNWAKATEHCACKHQRRDHDDEGCDGAVTGLSGKPEACQCQSFETVPEKSSLSPVQEEATPTLDAAILAETARFLDALHEYDQFHSTVATQAEMAAAIRRLQASLAGSISERETLTAQTEETEKRVTAWLNNLRAAMPGQHIVSPTGEAIVGAALGQLYQLAESQAAVARLTTERDKFRDWFQNAEQARAVAEANVERLTREKAAVEASNRELVKSAFDADKKVAAAVLGQAIQDIEALPSVPISEGNGESLVGGDDAEPHVALSEVLQILHRETCT